MRSESLVAMPGSMPMDAASSSVLVRLPLWPTANSVPPAWRYMGWALCHRRGPGRRVAGVADGQVPDQAGDLVVVEDLGDQAHVLHDHHGLAVAHRHPGRLLAPVLEGVEAVEDDGGDVAAGGVDAKDAARLAGAGVIYRKRPRTGLVGSRAGAGATRGAGPRTGPILSQDGQLRRDWRPGYRGGVIDLHTHSTVSDGSDSPEELVDLAAASRPVGLGPDRP